MFPSGLWVLLSQMATTPLGQKYLRCLDLKINKGNFRCLFWPPGTVKTPETLEMPGIWES